MCECVSVEGQRARERERAYRDVCRAASSARTPKVSLRLIKSTTQRETRTETTRGETDQSGLGLDLTALSSSSSLRSHPQFSLLSHPHGALVPPANRLGPALCGHRAVLISARLASQPQSWLSLLYALCSVVCVCVCVCSVLCSVLCSVCVDCALQRVFV